MSLFRYPAIFLIAVFLAVGSVPFERMHRAEAEREWASAAPTPNPVSSTPLKRMPVKPVHDSANCMICNLLHAPISAGQTSLISLAPTELLGYSQIAPPSESSPITTFAEHCRGPPVA